MQIPACSFLPLGQRKLLSLVKNSLLFPISSPIISHLLLACQPPAAQSLRTLVRGGRFTSFRSVSKPTLPSRGARHGFSPLPPPPRPRVGACRLLLPNLKDFCAILLFRACSFRMMYINAIAAMTVFLTKPSFPYGYSRCQNAVGILGENSQKRIKSQKSDKSI